MHHLVWTGFKGVLWIVTTSLDSSVHVAHISRTLSNLCQVVSMLHSCIWLLAFTAGSLFRSQVVAYY
jgi:hypothetical protein